ncbi:MAG: HAD family hydrolase [Gemmatimonadales bacterium]|nr:MAG: HAD family hydrolase [Gemmatimonadales bacterium]
MAGSRPPPGARRGGSGAGSVNLTANIPAELALRIRVVVLDADGILTNGGIYVADGEGAPFEARKFHVRDGVGLMMLRRAGIQVAIVSGKVSPAVRARAEDLGIEEIHQVDPFDKLPVVESVLQRAGARWEQAAFMGDDLADLPVLRTVGLPVTVPDAAKEVVAESRWISSVAGGEGAVREFAESLLTARGEWRGLVEEYVDECFQRWERAPGV